MNDDSKSTSYPGSLDYVKFALEYVTKFDGKKDVYDSWKMKLLSFMNLFPKADVKLILPLLLSGEEFIVFSRAVDQEASSFDEIIAILDKAFVDDCYQSKMKVVLIGANGSIGQPLSLLLKGLPTIDILGLYDVVSVKGLAADLSHISKPSKIIFSEPTKSGLKSLLNNADITAIAAGKSRSPGMSRDDMFNINSEIVAPLIELTGTYACDSMVCLISNPINSLIPMTAEILKATGFYNPKKLFGMTTIDSVRATAFVAEAKGMVGKKINVPIVGGHSQTTLIPLISQCVPPLSFPPTERAALTQRIQTAGAAVVAAKAGSGSASLSMAYAAARFITSLIEGMHGTKGVVECSFVESPHAPCEFFAMPLELGPHGIERSLGLGILIDYETQLLTAAIPRLEKHIRIGQEYGRSYVRTHLSSTKKV